MVEGRLPQGSRNHKNTGQGLSPVAWVGAVWVGAGQGLKGLREG